MKRPVFSFRPNMKDPNHRKAWEILQLVPEGEKTAYLVNAILRVHEQIILEDAEEDSRSGEEERTIDKRE